MGGPVSANSAVNGVIQPPLKGCAPRRFEGKLARPLHPTAFVVTHAHQAFPAAAGRKSPAALLCRPHRRPALHLRHSRLRREPRAARQFRGPVQERRHQHPARAGRGRRDLPRSGQGQRALDACGGRRGDERALCRRVRPRALSGPHHLRGGGAAGPENADRDRGRGAAFGTVNDRAPPGDQDHADALLLSLRHRHAAEATLRSTIGLRPKKTT